MMREEDFAQDIYGMRRMSEARGISEIPASGRFDFAFSDLDDDRLEAMRDDYGREGWGISTIFQEMLTRNPDTIKTGDVEETQQKLIEQGYAAPETPVDGVWSPYWNANLRRADRDAYDHHLDGKHAGSTPFSTAFEFMGYLSPLGVWRGMVSTARGLVEQAPQTAERLGILGSGLAGAGIGAVAGGPVGALVGGIAGLVGGTAAELTGAGESPEDIASGEERGLGDLLLPWEDYNGPEGTMRFFEDLGFIVSAASLLKGGTTAISAAKSFTGGMANTQAAAVAQAGSLREAVAQGTAQNVGYSTRLLARTMPAGRAENFRNFVGAHGLIAQMSRPMIRSSNSVFTGLATGTFGARVAERALPGESTIERQHNVLRVRDLKEFGRSDAEIAAEVGITEGEVKRRLAEPTALEPGSGYAGALDALGFVLQPTNFFPWRSKEVVGDGLARNPWSSQDVSEGFVGKVAGEDGWFPYDIALIGERTGGRLPGKEARRSQLMRAMSGGTDEIDHLEVASNDFRFRISMGLDYQVQRDLGAMGDISPVERLRRRNQLSAKYKKEMLDEWESLDVTAATTADAAIKMPRTTEALSWGFGDPHDASKGPAGLAAWVADLQGRGSGIDRIGGQVRAEKTAERLTKDITSKKIALRWGEGGAEEGVVRLTAPLTPPTNPDYEGIQKQISKTLDEAVAFERQVPTSTDPEALAAQAMSKRQEAEGLRAQLKTTPKLVKPRQQVTLTPANLEDAERGLPGTVTDRVLQNHLDDWEQAVARLDELDVALKPKLADQSEPALALFQEHQATRGNLQMMLKQFQREDLIGQDTFRGVMDAIDSNEIERLTAVSARLEEMRPYVPREVTLPPELQTELQALGKTLVATAEDKIFYSDIPRELAARNVDLFAKQPELMDTLRYYSGGIGFSPALHSNNSLFRFRSANQGRELHQALLDEGVELTGKQGMRRIRRAMEEHNSGEGIVQKGPLLLHPGKKPGDAAKTTMPLFDVRHITPAMIREALDLDRLVPEGRKVEDVARRAYDALKRGSALGAEVDMRHPIDSVKMLSKNLRASGWPGFVDFMRTFHLDDPKGASALTGALGGAITADDGMFSEEGLRNAVVGAGLGMGLDKVMKSLPKNHYMYLPEHLHRASMALRYTFSLAFDAGRYMEKATLGLAREDLPVYFAPRRYIARTFDGVDGMTGDEHWKEAIALRDRMSKKSNNTFDLMDEIERRAFQRGILGYAPRMHEASAAYILHRRHPKMSLGQLEEKVSMLEGYGLGRSTIEKSVNFFFFPFSFTKKLVTSLGDAVLQAPARALLIHHGFKEFERTGAADASGEFIEQYLPIANQMKRLNNLAYGLGVGRFFMAGQADRDTDLGKSLGALSTLFVPSGANTPISQLFGGLGDSAVNFFVPQVITDETPLDEALQTIDTFLPALRDITNFAQGAYETGLAVTEGGAPFYQLQNYYDERREIEQDYAPMAKAFGYTTVRGFMESDIGIALLPEYEARLEAVNNDYPLGATEAQRVTNSASLNDLMLSRLEQKPNRSPAEEQILRLVEIERQGEVLSEILGMDTETITTTLAPQVREESLRMWSSREFREYYGRLFASKYGPIERVA